MIPKIFAGQPIPQQLPKQAIQSQATKKQDLSKGMKSFADVLKEASERVGASRR